jgi:hypothetical protein
MPSPLVLAGVGAGLNVLGGLTGEWWASGDEAERERLEREAAAQYAGLTPPQLEALQAQQAETAFADAPSDFGNKTARNAAIQALMNEGLSGGNSLESKVAQANAQRAAGQAARAGSQSALQSAQARGMGGAASTLQAQLLGASTGADRAAQVGLQGAFDARRNALAALQQGGSMAGQAEESDAARDARVRDARDRISLFNAEQRGATDRFNSGLKQQGFDNSLQLANAKAGSAYRQADSAAARAAQKRKVAGGVGQAVGQGFTAFSGGGR